MRRFLLTALVLAPLVPGLAMAQTAAPPSGDDGMGMMGGPDGGQGGWGKDHDHHHHGMDPAVFLTGFYSANTTHDGHLTLAQAKAANFEPVASHFSEIDVAKHGYVTFYDIEAWHLDQMAQHLENRANQLRAKD